MNLDGTATDSFTGSIVWIDDMVMAIGGPDPNVQTSARYRGPVVIRYAFAFLAKGAESFVPKMVFDDFQKEHHAFDAIAFLRKKGDAFPRADVQGYNAADGEERTVFVKAVDLARPLRVFAYPGPGAVSPLTQIDAVVWQDNAPSGSSEGIDHVSDLLNELRPAYTIGTDVTVDY
ncbi:MAG: hypothetical protein ACFB51_19550, partial [Anaerolineae bacterium]